MSADVYMSMMSIVIYYFPADGCLYVPPPSMAIQPLLKNPGSGGPPAKKGGGFSRSSSVVDMKLMWNERPTCLTSSAPQDPAPGPSACPRILELPNAPRRKFLSDLVLVIHNPSGLSINGVKSALTITPF